MAAKDLYIGGEWISGYGPVFKSQDPSNGEIIWSRSSASSTDVARAVKAAEKAFSAWALLPIEERINYLMLYQNILKEEKEQFKLAISRETGKPLWESATEVDSMINKITISIEAYRLRCAEIRKEVGNGLSVTRHKPHGAVGVLGPFNFPAHLPHGHIVPALLAGNTIVFKPSEETPLVGQLMAEYWDLAQLPKGVFNLIQGKKEAGIALSSNPNLKGLYFTGSYPTGVSLAAQFAKTPGRILALEMGGNNPLVISLTKDHLAAAYTTVQSAYITAGQRCTCARRLIVIENGAHEDFLNKLVHLIKNIVVGYYSNTPEPFMGPVINETSVIRLLTAQAALQMNGGKSLVEMQRLGTSSLLVSPGLIDVTDIKELPDEEYFGPLLQVIRVPDLDAAIQKANETAYGLSAGLISDSEEEFRKFYQLVNAGVINWNSSTTGASSAAPFGGLGKSGNHRPSALYAADYCATPIASMEVPQLVMPNQLLPGIEI